MFSVPALIFPYAPMWSLLVVSTVIRTREGRGFGVKKSRELGIWSLEVSRWHQHAILEHQYSFDYATNPRSAICVSYVPLDAAQSTSPCIMSCGFVQITRCFLKCVNQPLELNAIPNMSSCSVTFDV